MKQLTRYEMEDIMIAHEKAELEYDLDATMETLVPVPHYEVPFLGLMIDGYDAVREIYKRLIKLGAQDRNIQAVARVLAEAPNTLIREAHVSFDTSDGGRVTGLYIVVMEFDPESKKIVGERMYADTTYADFVREFIGDDLLATPGITRIADSAPIIDAHDAFEMAAARGIHIDNPANKR